MANASRDPYWNSKVRREVALLPGLRDTIEVKCMSCHAPAQHRPAVAQGARLHLDDLSRIGKDGVTCTVCHQITSEKLGTAASFTGGFALGEKRLAFGPHPEPFTHPMLMHTGFEPREGRHVLESALCGTCHTVITPTVDQQGKIIGDFLEQAPFLEWLAAGFPKETSCQSCHVPVLTGATGKPEPHFIAHRPPGGAFPPTRRRTPFGRHEFVGGNVEIPEYLASVSPDDAPALTATANRARRNLGRAVSLDLASSRKPKLLELRVRVNNLTGHKVPTGFPSRRLWLHVAVTDAKSQRVFESGAFNPSTGVLASDDQPCSQEHYSVIERPSQVMIFESVMKDPSGSCTVDLLRAAGYHKDNRLLPEGFNAKAALPKGIDVGRIAPVGVGKDPDFAPGSDTVVYRIPLPSPAAPFRIRVEACYQSIRPRDLKDLDASAAEEGRQFLRTIRRKNPPVIIATAEASVP